MTKTTNRLLLATLFCSALTASQASAQMRITEWMYSGEGGEFVEFTNVGTTSIDMTDWSFDDDHRLPDVLDLSAFGPVGAGESVIISQDPAAVFRQDWNLSSSIKIIGDYTNNLSRNDEINLFDASDALVDRLTFGDEDFPGSIRAQDFSGNPRNTAAVGANDALLWTLSSIGDAYGSYASTLGDVGNPGSYVAVPEPSAIALIGVALVGAIRFRRRCR